MKDLPHSFVFNRESRRMVCEWCGAVMNEGPPICPKSQEQGGHVEIMYGD